MLLLANKLIEKIPDPRNAKEHYQSFIRKKITKFVKRSEIVTYQPKTFENPNIVEIKSVIAEHPETSHKLSKTVGNGKKVGANSSLYSDTKNGIKILKITKREHACKGYVSIYDIDILNSFNPELQLKDTESAIKSKLIELLTQLKDFKFVTAIVLVFKEIETKSKTKYDNFYSSSKAKIIINESDIDDVFQSIYTIIKKKIQKSLEKGLGWIIDSVINHTVRISKYNCSAESNYIKLPKQLDNPRKGLTNIQNIDNNESFKCCLARYLNPTNHHPARITKADKDFPKNLEFKSVKFPVKNKDIHKAENRIPLPLVFFAIKIKKNIDSMYQKDVDLLLIGEGGQKALCSYQIF